MVLTSSDHGNVSGLVDIEGKNSLGVLDPRNPTEVGPFLGTLLTHRGCSRKR
ncbi:hypothetical protein PISMIDRAFT_670297 [Pisolithus microcarpus 441]|uniref:Unplaced genomic scaffold scaffold_1, whole genome shotgun sequence n=1 Tax=Pisolithus microcarpus 441 TaxID=765257 RepID=A0A0D0AAI0_9AGAM|nr:hypothetical protein PISMIDRAFT_670297 [Pisolithus microcarpus 441]